MTIRAYLLWFSPHATHPSRIESPTVLKRVRATTQRLPVDTSNTLTW